MADQNKRVCGYCHLNRDWIWNGHKLKDGSKVYVDQSGQRWAGRRCPQCEKSRVATAVRHDAFDKDMIFSQLAEKGFEIKTKTHPVLAEKNGQLFQVGIRRARMENGRITLESAPDLRDDVVALVFESVRIVTPDQLQSMDIFSPNEHKHSASSQSENTSPSI